VPVCCVLKKIFFFKKSEMTLRFAFCHEASCFVALC
jgi:hypothetical protein